MTVGPANETHFGRVVFDVRSNISVIIITLKLEAKKKTFVDQTVNFCKWVGKPRLNYIVDAFRDYYQKQFNPLILQCPVREGIYVAAEDRLIPNIGLLLPKFVPKIDNITFTLTVKSMVQNKLQPVFRITEVYEFYWQTSIKPTTKHFNCFFLNHHRLKSNVFPEVDFDHKGNLVHEVLMIKTHFTVSLEWLKLILKHAGFFRELYKFISNGSQTGEASVIPDIIPIGHRYLCSAFASETFV